MKKFLSTIFIVAYSAIAIITTILLLSFNQYRCSEVAGYTFYIVTDDSLEPEFVNGDLLIIKNSTGRSVQIGDTVFMYRTISSSEFEVISDTVVGMSGVGNKTTYQLQNRGLVDSSYLIGEVKDTQSFHYLGTVLSILESKWGYLFFIVIVSLLLFLQQVFDLYMELKYGELEDDGEVEVVKTRTKSKSKTVNKAEVEEVEEDVEETKPKARKTTKAKTTKTTESKPKTKTTTKAKVKSETKEK